MLVSQGNRKAGRRLVQQQRTALLTPHPTKSATDQRNGWSLNRQLKTRRQRSFRSHHSSRIGGLQLTHRLHQSLGKRLLTLQIELFSRGNSGLPDPQSNGTDRRRRRQQQPAAQAMGQKHTGQSEQAPATPGCGLLEQRQQAAAPAQLQPGQPSGTEPAGQSRQGAVPGKGGAADADPEQRRPRQHQFSQGPDPGQQHQPHWTRPTARQTPRQHRPSGQEQSGKAPAGQPEGQCHRQAEPGGNAHPGEWMQGQQPAVAHQNSQQSPGR